MAYILTILKTALLVIGLLFISVNLAWRLRKMTYTLLYPRIPTWASFLSNIVQLLVLGASLELIIYVAGINTAVILTVVAIFTAGVSLALDGSVRDVIATAKLLTFGYYKVDDLVTLDGHTGKVVDITAFSTILETGSRDKVIIGNKEIIDKIIMNHTAVKGRAISVNVPVHGEHCREQVMDLLLRAAQQCAARLPSTEFVPTILYELMPEYEKYTISLVIPNEVPPHQVTTNLALAAANLLQENGIQLGRERICGR